MGSMPPLFPVAVIGTGQMGGGMAARLLDGGWPVHVCDLLPERVAPLVLQGGQAHAQAGAAAANCQVTIIAVVDAAQCEQVLFGPGGLADAVAPGHVVLLCPTIAPQDTEALAARLAQCGVAMLDAPMSGGPTRARDGSMSLMVAGDELLWQRLQPLLQVLSSRLFRISERIGDGARTKLVNNLLAGINLVGAAEVLALAGRLGLDAARTLAVIEQSSGQSWIGSDRMHRALQGDLEPRAQMSLLQKDTALAQQAAAAVGFAGPLGPAAADVFRAACAQGLAGRDDGALLHWLQRRD